MAAVNFPNNPSVNDTHTSSGSTWKWDGGVWQRLGEAGPQGAQGVQGAQGHQGVQGAQGHQGRQGATGSTGSTGAQGHQGVQGAQGHQGRQGSVGAQGATNNLTIATSPPGSPTAGDLWWDSDDGDLHTYFNDGNSSQWVNINNGPAGAQGAQGAAGAAGAQGAQGRQGAAGAQGAQGAQGHQGVQGSAGSFTTDSEYNLVAGVNAGNSFSGTNAVKNILLGYDAGTTITTGDNNIAIGYMAFAGSDGGNNTGSGNIAIGREAMKQGAVTGDCNIIIGDNRAGRLLSSGSHNIGMGQYSLHYMSTGTGNIGIGYCCLDYAQGSYNTAVGHNAGTEVHGTGGSGSYNTLLGYLAGGSLSSGSNCIIIGNNAQATTNSTSNEITLGNANINRFRVPGVKITVHSTAVGINTDDASRANLADPVGAGHSLVGLYIGDGSVLFNNTLNRTGGYYISTETNALNAGPVTLDAQMKLDGVWVIV